MPDGLVWIFQGHMTDWDILTLPSLLDKKSKDPWLRGSSLWKISVPDGADEKSPMVQANKKSALTQFSIYYEPKKGQL